MNIQVNQSRRPEGGMNLSVSIEFANYKPLSIRQAKQQALLILQEETSAHNKKLAARRRKRNREKAKK